MGIPYIEDPTNFRLTQYCNALTCRVHRREFWQKFRRCQNLYCQISVDPIGAACGVRRGAITVCICRKLGWETRYFPVVLSRFFGA
jgi:hypothetical protein